MASIETANVGKAVVGRVVVSIKQRLRFLNGHLALWASGEGTTSHQQIKVYLDEISYLGIIIQQLLTLINQLLLYIIRSFHRERHSSSRVTYSDEDSSASYGFQLSNDGAVQGMSRLFSYS